METATLHASSATSPAPARPAAPAASAPRVDLYAAIHKTMRLWMCGTLTRVGSTDPADAMQVGETLAAVRSLLDGCIAHLTRENEFLHPAMERARPGTSAQIAGEHVEHVDAVEELAELAMRVEAAQGPARAAALHHLYRSLALFVAENFEHMHYEETEHNAVLWAHYTDDELLALERRLIAAIPPEVMMGLLHWMLPAVAAPERLAMFTDMRAHAPGEAFQAVVSLARARLTPGEWVKLARGLDIPPAPQMWPEFVEAR